jgi:hypothetical protein
VVREEVRLGLAFYRAEGEVERTAEAVAAVSAVAGAINGGGARCGGFGEGKGPRRRWMSAAAPLWRSGGGGGARGAGEAAPGCGSRRPVRGWGAAGGRGWPRQVGPTCRWL